MKRVLSIVLVAVIAVGAFGFQSALAAGTPALTNVLAPIYEDIGYVYDGVMWTIEYRDGKTLYKYVDEKGATVIDVNKLIATDGFQIELNDMREGIAWIDCWNDEDYFCLAVDKSGKTIFDSRKYTEAYIYGAGPFSSGKSIMFAESGFFCLDKSGTVTKISVAGVEDHNLAIENRFMEGLIPYHSNNGWGYLDTNFKPAFAAEFADALHFNQGLAPASDDSGKWGFIDKTGKWVIQPKYSSYWLTDYDYSYTAFHDGIAFAQRADNLSWVMVDKTGKELFTFDESKFTLESGVYFFDGVASVKGANGKYGYIDKTGAWVITPQFDDANVFSNGVALVGNFGDYKFIDKTGKVVSQSYAYESSGIAYSNRSYVIYSVKGLYGMAKITITDTPAVDEPNSWAKEWVNRAISAKLLPGNLQSKYTQNTTRAEFSAMIVPLIENVLGAPIEITTTCPDSNDENILKLISAGVMAGTGGGNADPNGLITRETAAILIAKAARHIGLDEKSVDLKFTDKASIASWSVDFVKYAVAYEIFTSAGETFKPKDPYTRQECIITVVRLYDLLNK